jgi:uncharacterized membrane protein
MAEQQILIHRPIETVYAFVSAHENAPSWNPRVADVRALTPPPLGKGSRYLQRGQTAVAAVDVTLEVFDYEPPYYYGLRSVAGPLRVELRFRFARHPEGTLLTFDGTFKPQGPLKLLSPMLARVAETELVSTLPRLKACLEASMPL